MISDPPSMERISQRTGWGLRGAALVTGLIVGALAVSEWVGNQATPVFWVRLGTAVTSLVLAALSFWRSRLERALGWMLALTTTSALVLMSAFTGGSGSTHFLILLAAPLVACVIVPHELGVVIVMGLLCAIGGSYVLVQEGSSASFVVRFALQALALTGFAIYGSVRYRRLRAQLDEKLQSETRRLGDALSATTGRLFRLREEREIYQTAAKALRDEGLRVAVFMLRGWKLIDAETPGEPIRLEHYPVARRALTDGRAVVRRTDLPVPVRLQGDGTAVRHLAVDAPLKMDDEPFGLLCVDGPGLSEGAAAAVELFAGQVAAAIENARHHRDAAQRLGELVQLQGALVARERLAALGEAAAVVAHEVRNPLGAIANAISLLRRGEADPKPLLNLVEEEVRRLDGLVRDMLFLARPLSPRLQKVALADVLSHAVTVTRGVPITVPSP